MKTIKLPIQINISNIQKEFSSLVRFSFNRFQDNQSEKQIRHLIKSKNFNLNSWLSQCAIKDAKMIFEKHQNKPIIFGGKQNWSNYIKKLINKDQFKQNRLFLITIQGEECKKGNRLFKLNMNENQIIFKESRNNHIIIQLPKLRKNIKKELFELERLSNLNQISYTIKLTNSNIYITFDESKLYFYQNNLYENRILGIDLNPNYIGYSILEFNKNNDFNMLYNEMVDFSKLTKNSGKSSDSNESKYLVNKHKHEIYESIKRVVNQAIHFRCSKLVIEDLNIKNKNHKKGKNFNRLVNNKWNRNKYMESLKKWCKIYGIELVEVNLAYSSVIGNIKYCKEYNVLDMVGSSIELARRGYKKFEKGWFYLRFDLDKLQILNQWKEDMFEGIGDWKELFNKVKNLKLKYRVQLVDMIDNAVWSRDNIKSGTILYSF